MRRLVSLTLLVLASPATAQTTETGRASPVTTQATQPGRVAGSANGTAGQRQTRDETTPNVAPVGRVASRIGNRVQSRIRNRIDRYYSPQANAASPFAVAGEQARATVRTTRR